MSDMLISTIHHSSISIHQSFFLLQANTSALFNVADLQLIAPELILTVCACVALVMEVILPYRKSRATAYFALVGIALAALRWECNGGWSAVPCR